MSALRPHTVPMDAGPSPVFRILQVTDIHADVSEVDNIQTRDGIRRLADLHSPDLLMVTGDVWCSDDKPHLAPMWRNRELSFLNALGVPWALTYGNHDYTENDPAGLLASIGRMSNARIPAPTPRGDFRIELRRDGEALWDLFVLNSGEAWRMPGDLDWFLAETDALRREREKTVPALLFFHIPLGNHQRAIDEGRFNGLALEPASGWGDDDGCGAELVKGAGNVRACFCGHMHRNDGWFDEGGVRFHFSRSSGFGGYGHDTTPKGGRLIEIDLATGALESRTVLHCEG